MSEIKIAVPADAAGGLDSPVSGHFGHCAAFIVSTIRDGEIVDVSVLHNRGHSSCAQPVELLAANGVSVLITSGMGMRPYMVTQQLGIQVARAQGRTVGEAINSYLMGTATAFGTDGVCQGGGHQHS